MTIAQIFANFGAELRPQDLTPDVIHHAKRAVIDWYAAWLPGSIEPPATLLEIAMSDDLDRGSARLAQGRLSTPRTAAMINATAAHTVEVDDIYREAIYHPGAPTIAAALAIGQAQGASGLAFLTAVVAGYEISTRIGAAMGREHDRYWHNTGTVGTFGAAAAASRAPGFSIRTVQRRTRPSSRRKTCWGARLSVSTGWQPCSSLNWRETTCCISRHWSLGATA